MNYTYTDDHKVVFFKDFKCIGFFFNLCFIFRLNNGKYSFCGITTKTFVRNNLMGI